MSIFKPPASNTRQFLIGKWLLIAGLVLVAFVLSSMVLGFGRFAMLGIIAIFVLGGVYEMIRGARLLLRVLTNWMPGFTVLSALYEGWLDADPGA